MNKNVSFTFLHLNTLGQKVNMKIKKIRKNKSLIHLYCGLHFLGATVFVSTSGDLIPCSSSRREIQGRLVHQDLLEKQG